MKRGEKKPELPKDEILSRCRERLLPLLRAYTAYARDGDQKLGAMLRDLCDRFDRTSDRMLAGYRPDLRGVPDVVAATVTRHPDDPFWATLGIDPDDPDGDEKRRLAVKWALLRNWGIGGKVVDKFAKDGLKVEKREGPKKAAEKIVASGTDRKARTLNERLRTAPNLYQSLSRVPDDATLLDLLLVSGIDEDEAFALIAALQRTIPRLKPDL